MRTAILILGSLLSLQHAYAQSWTPNKPLRLIVPQVAGGGADAGDGGDGKWTMKSLDSIYRMLATAATANKERHHDDDAVIDYLKMDIEWDEWAVLPQIIGSGMLAKIRQLTVEFHLPTKFIPSSRDDDDMRQSLINKRRLLMQNWN